ncbi:MMPL family RND transporter [Mycolicibacterium chubuense]|uniref:Membrane transport protein mmpL8 n=1 Tax=Mycolicibacterium chubuense TaxID=1800 RepID=A0A0J6YPR7_MYCCU|nr:Membrane transport protein mmpL8 [Mycolicibacterium chubuense]ORA44075.1 MMPL family RND transporter [Mycolicibacterium chubuense]SPY46343.1 Transport protein [Mycolicibacterium chubuense]
MGEGAHDLVVADAAPGTARGGGIFGRVGDVVVRWPWIVIAVWIGLAVVLPPLFPTLVEATQKQPVSPLPADAPSIVATQQMGAAFDESGSENVLLVLLTDERGLGKSDEQVYGTLVDRLRRDNEHVVMIEDFVSTPALRPGLTSEDGKAWLMPIGLAGELGSPESYDSYTRVADVVRHTVEGSTLTANLTGPAATFADSLDVGTRDQVKIEAAIITLLLAILLIIYRKPATIMLPLVTIGVSLGIAQAAVAGAAVLGLGVSPQTITLLSGMMAGAGTDYAVFLISRYHDFVRAGQTSDDAVRNALGSIGKVIAASAATVGVTFMAMTFARLELFATIGPALAIGIAVAFLASVTLLPSIIVLTGRRGWVAPRRDLTSRFWRRSGIRIVRRPVANLVASLTVLMLLAGCVLFVKFNYDDRKALPDNVESSVGYLALDRHFPVNTTIPQYLLVQSPRDLRTPKALADLEQMAQRISQLPDIAAVRGITRPSGKPLKEASTTFQAGEVGSKLDNASTLIRDRTTDLDKLASGADQLADGLKTLREQVTKLMSGLTGILTTMQTIQNQFGGATTLGQLGDPQLVNNMRALGDSMQAIFGDMTKNFAWIDPVVIALDGSPYCNDTPLCVSARDQFRRVQTARDDGSLQKLVDQLQSSGPASTLTQTVTKLSQSMKSLTGSMGSLGLGGAGGGRGQSPLGNLGGMQEGLKSLADGGRQVADGVAQLVDQTKKMGTDLGDASTFLLTMRNSATSPSMAGFFIPSQVLDSDDFKKAATFFISPDGHAARYLIQTDLNPFGTDAMDQVIAVTDTARGAQPNTELADGSISMTGYPATLRDARDYYDHDMRYIVIVTIAVVLFILIALLRAIVAPVYLIASVILSYLAALGLGVVTFQFLLGQELHWSVPGLTFIILVAMGADYNMLLISRIRDESPRGMRSGVIRTVGATGGVITAAGLIFAASMFGLLFASISTIIQAGFVVGTGILLDTFLVRTVTVPAMAVLVGRANWWPSRWRPRPPASRARQDPVPVPDPV